MSAPSRLIQTLQDAPDSHPSNLTLLSATQTSLRFNWKPLPETEFNSSPETVGYRLRVWRTDGQGEDRTEDVEREGGTSETTVEGLNPFTQYQVQIQAYNSIGSGPWSNTVAALTAESVPSGSPVFYSEKDSEGPPSVQVAEGEGSVTLILSGLKKYTVYELQVLAYTRMGYQISYCLDSRDPQRWTTVEVGSTARQFTVTGLSSEQAYVFRLTARTAVGWGEEQEALVVTTERRASPAAQEVVCSSGRG
ncbi:hypothetical protein F7725_005757 [Dissostichus mawsoni]|uniref:Fibronectin type-III domain-containing protein n=1 Tax=Dissostichus mawsoni TaxID=36200 RepID=A0A7J5YS53_DISMA|nr:hypothetical protein F7725_005757 [Dissostichus mawsoni]